MHERERNMSSDQYFAQRASRQRRMLILAGLLVLLLLCGLLAVRNAFYDRCTASFDRSADSVIQSYLGAIRAGDLPRVQSCWDRAQYYEIEAGCSEICLSRLMGMQFDVAEVSAGAPEQAAGRARMDVAVSLVCPDGSAHSGTLVLDAVGGDVPWKHWRVLQSEVGGSPAQRWCGE